GTETPLPSTRIHGHPRVHFDDANYYVPTPDGRPGNSPVRREAGGPWYASNARMRAAVHAGSAVSLFPPPPSVLWSKKPSARAPVRYTPRGSTSVQTRISRYLDRGRGRLVLAHPTWTNGDQVRLAL